MGFVCMSLLNLNYYIKQTLLLEVLISGINFAVPTDSTPPAAGSTVHGAWKWYIINMTN